MRKAFKGALAPRLVTLLLAGTALSAVSSTVAMGQQAAAPEAKPEARKVQDIVVTAQRREQNLQDVPLAVSAVTGASLETQGINNPVELRYVAPSVNFSNSANTRGEGFQIRGVGTVIFGDGIEQSVGVVVDGIPMGRGGMGTSDLIDVQRVEVLRGPQGMLFGKNASAGLISITTNAPVIGETSLALRGSFATLNEVKLNATGNLALGDKAALRVAYASTTRDGIIRNVFRNEDLNDRDEKVLRARFTLNATEKLTFNLIGDWSERNSLCCAWTARSAPATTAFGALNAAAGIVPSPTNLRIAAGAPFFQNINTNGLSAQVDYDFGGAVLTSITGWRNWFAVDNNDPDLLPINVLDRNTGDSDVTQVSQELRLNSTKAGPFEWTIGGLYYRMTNTGSNSQAGTLGVALPPGATLGSDRFSTTINDSVAIYGQAQYTFAEKLTLIAGGRYTNEKVSVNYIGRPTPGSLAGIPGRFNGVGSGSIKADNFSYRLIAQYRFAPDIMAYASYAKGYKGPGIDQNVVAATPTFVQPEIPTSYEGGVRSTLFDGKVTFNAALFLTKFKDFQAQVFDQNVFPARFLATNAGELESKGVEAELYVRPVTGLTLSANAAYIESKYTDFKNIACYAAQPILPFGTPRTSPRQCIRQVSATGTPVTEGTGNDLPNSPRLTYNIAANYSQPIGGLLGTFNVNYFWRDKVNYSDAGDPGASQGSYGLLGASIGIGASDDRWRVSLFGKNLTDQNFVDRVIGQPVLGAVGVYSQFVSPEARRIVGVSLDVKFGG